MTTATRRIWAVAAGAALVLVLVWYLAAFRPQSHRLHNANATYTQTEQQIAQLRTKVKGLEALKTQVPHDKAELKRLTAAVPKGPDLKDVLDQLQTLAVTSGVQLTSVNPSMQPTPSNTSAAGSTQVVQLNLATNGSYPQLMSFVSGLAKLQRTVVVESTTIGSQASGALDATFNAEIFYTQ